MRRILSGIQPTGIPHLGNYFGAIKPWTELQKHKMLISIVDLHALTVSQNPEILRKNIQYMALSLLACGINDDNTIFRQSKISEHSELAWLLFCRTPISWLSRMHQWKQKTNEEADGHLGLLSYPVLQAADILLYKATEIPVGDDQRQHMNLTSMIAKSFNSHYQLNLFPVPKALYANDMGMRIMSLKDPTKKMSKSDPNKQASILINDESDVIAKKIRKATTDSVSGIFYSQERFGINNLLNIVQSIRKVDVEKEFGSLTTAQFKQRVADELIAHLSPIRERFNELEKDPQRIQHLLKRGEKEAKELASATLAEVHKCIGISEI